MFKKMFSWFKTHWLLSVIAILLVFFLISSFIGKEMKAKQEFQALQTVPFAAKDLVKTLDLSGVVDAKRKVKLFYPTGGKLTKINVKKGDTVIAGQVLAVVDQADLQKRLEKSLNNYMTDRLQFDDYQDQFKTRSPSEKENLTSQLDQLGLENSVLDVEISSLAINNTKLTSPISGLVTAAPELVAPINILATDSFTVIDPQSLIFRVMVDELDLNLIHEGQAAKISFDALPELQTSATIANIALTSTVSTSGTAFEVEFALPNLDLTQLRLGLNGDAKVILAEKKQVGSIPLEALYVKDGRQYVKVLDQNKKQVLEKTVTTGLETDDDIEILTGLNWGDLVVIN